MEQKKQEFLVKVSDDMPMVVADELRLKQVLLNLLSNANKFTDEGGKIVLVATADDPRFATVAVTDTGRGMTSEEVEIALKAFAQIDSNYSRQQEGTGLGLPISKALVQRQGGQFYVQSAPGVGTAIAFTLPLAPTSQASKQTTTVV